MITDKEKIVIEQIHAIENKQRLVMKEINAILMSIPDVFSAGEETYPELKSKNQEMTDLIIERIKLMVSIGLEPKGPLPDNIDTHYLETMLS